MAADALVTPFVTRTIHHPDRSWLLVAGGGQELVLARALKQGFQQVLGARHE